MRDSTELFTRSDSTVYRKICENLRGQILSGNFAPGTRLPSVRELAATWGSSVFTIQTALKELVKQGWIDRRHGSGTFIADPKSRFLDVGIYYGGDFRTNTSTGFIRNLHFSMLDQLQRLKKRAHVFIDHRPDYKQKSVMPAVMKAIAERRIQALISPSINHFNCQALAELALPTAFISNPFSSKNTDFDTEQLFREGMRQLSAQGCRSVGLISNLWLSDSDTPAEQGYQKSYYDHFHQAAEAAEVATRDEWILRPDDFVHDLEKHGYDEMKKMLRLREKPDGIIVLPDMVAIGVVIAVLELGRTTAPKPMKFVFHRNAHIRLLCPFPVTWAISDEDVLAQGLIRMLQRQFDGKKVSPSRLPYIFKQGGRRVPE